MPISPYLKALRAKIGTERVMAPAAAMAPVKDGRVLLARNAETGEWQSLGGMLDPLEHPADGAVREAYEEAGVLTRPTRLIGVFGGPKGEIVYPNGDVVAYTMTAFAGVLIDENAPLRPDGEEIAELGWFGAEEVKALEMLDLNRRVSLAALTPEAEALFEPASWRPNLQP